MERIYNTIIKFNNKRKKFLFSCIGIIFLAFSISLFLGDNEIPEKIGKSIIYLISETLLNIF